MSQREKRKPAKQPVPLAQGSLARRVRQRICELGVGGKLCRESFIDYRRHEKQDRYYINDMTTELNAILQELVLAGVLRKLRPGLWCSCRCDYEPKWWLIRKLPNAPRERRREDEHGKT